MVLKCIKKIIGLGGVNPIATPSTHSNPDVGHILFDSGVLFLQITDAKQAMSVHNSISADS
jgi:hypothetical protein